MIERVRFSQTEDQTFKATMREDKAKFSSGFGDLKVLQGPKGDTGPQGPAGKDGYTPIKGKDYFDGVNGKDGKTPVKGVDYFTDAEIAEIVDEVAAQGVGVLFVHRRTGHPDGEGYATHTPKQIFEHISKGGTAVFVTADGFQLPCVAAMNDFDVSIAVFSAFVAFGDESTVLWAGIETGAAVVFEGAFAPASKEELDALAERLDNAGGGGGTLFVTVDYDTMTASHTPAEMAEHIANGGKVFVALDGEFAAVSACNEEMAAVVLVIPDVEGGTNVGVLTVDADKAVSVVEISAGGGITVDDALDPNSTNPLQNKVVYEAVLSVGQKAAQAYNTAEGAGMAAAAAQTIANEVAERLDSVPKPSDVPFDGFALVTKGGKWVLSDAPVATMSNLASISGGVSAAHGRVDELESYFASFQADVNAYVGDLDTALDSIIDIQEELIGVTLITFTIDGTEYQAEEGMTWVEWCVSEYNIGDEWHTAGVDEYVIRTDNWYLMHSDGKVQVGGDVAVDGATYVLD